MASCCAIKGSERYGSSDKSLLVPGPSIVCRGSLRHLARALVLGCVRECRLVDPAGTNALAGFRRYLPHPVSCLDDNAAMFFRVLLSTLDRSSAGADDEKSSRPAQRTRSVENWYFIYICYIIHRSTCVSESCTSLIVCRSQVNIDSVARRSGIIRFTQTA